MRAISTESEMDAVETVVLEMEVPRSGTYSTVIQLISLSANMKICRVVAL